MICLCTGGLDVKMQEAMLRMGPDVVIATPGRLIDHLHNAPNFSLDSIEILVLDEADRYVLLCSQDNDVILACYKNLGVFCSLMCNEISFLWSILQL